MHVPKASRLSDWYGVAKGALRVPSNILGAAQVVTKSIYISLIVSGSGMAEWSRANGDGEGLDGPSTCSL